MQDEQQRIVQAGGTVSQLYGVWRVNGSISVARSIGDCHLKARITFIHSSHSTSHLTLNTQEILISAPDVATLALDGTEDFLILACDGLWDVVSQASVRLRHHQPR